jgi:hypothetical protein
MTLVRVDAADDDVVSQDHFGGDIACGGSGSPVTAADTRKADDASSRDFPYGVGYDWSGARAFDDNVWPESDAGDSAGVVRGTQSAHEVRLEAGVHPIKNMNLQSALHSEQCCEQSNWTCARHKHSPRIPKRTPSDRVDLFPCLVTTVVGSAERRFEGQQRNL